MKPQTNSSIFPSNKKKLKKIERWDIPNKLKKRRREYQQNRKELETQPFEKPIYILK